MSHTVSTLKLFHLASVRCTRTSTHCLTCCAIVTVADEALNNYSLVEGVGAKAIIRQIINKGPKGEAEAKRTFKRLILS